MNNSKEVTDDYISNLINIMTTRNISDILIDIENVYKTLERESKIDEILGGDMNE